MELRLIDALPLIKELEKAINMVEKLDAPSSKGALRECFSLIINAPTVEPVQWVPVSERLPMVDKYGDVNVLVCMDDGFIASATYDKSNGWELWADSGEVTHWMPLPSPPPSKEGE